ncbi:MAG: septal ring lytic transglycosylase RlpA family protein [Arenimonas sp.]|nr:septal ring lytic transglycosylase RlpA family protein [Arenimonas sp.]
MRLLLPALVVLLLTACGSKPTRPAQATQAPASQAPGLGKSAAKATGLDPCAPTRQHLDSDYTPGGLYAPGVADSGPATAIDVSGVREPVPRNEPRSRYGNRSPYTVLGKSYHVRDSARGYHERGVASWYGAKFNGRATSSGELYDMCLFSAAHKTLPLPSFVRVTNLDNGHSLIVRVNDRGPFHSGRIMDLSYAAAVRLGVDRTGTARVELQAVVEGEDSGPAPVQVAQESVSAAEGADRIVQVGSFGDKANARRLADRLLNAGVDGVEVDQAEVAGQHVWRVRIGPLGADKLPGLLEHLQRLDLPSPRVFAE